MNRLKDFLPCPVWRTAQRRPHAPALRLADHQVISYGSLHVDAEGIKTLLHQCGLRPRQTVAVAATPHPSVITVLLALWRLRCIVFPLSPKWPAAHTASLLSMTNTKYVLVRKDQHRLVETAQGPWTVLDIDELVRLSRAPLVRSRVNHENLTGFHRDDLITWVATSGTLKGRPKIAALSFGNHFYNALGAIPRLRLRPVDTWLLSLPLYHVSGLSILFRTWLVGAGVALPGPAPVEEFLKDDQTVTHLSVVPTQWIRWMDEKALRRRLADMRCVLMGGAPIPPDLVNQARRDRVALSLTYGMTETAGQIATSTPGTKRLKPLPHRSYRVDENGRVFVRGRVLFKGYLTPQGLSLPLSEKGDFFTGDHGREDQGDGLIILGRWDRMFISGGENIQPDVIEKHLAAMPGVTQAAVLPRDDDEFGHVPVAVLAFRNRASAKTYDDVKKWLSARLPPEWIPKAIYAWPELPHDLKPSCGLLQDWLKEGKLTLLSGRRILKKGR